MLDVLNEHLEYLQLPGRTERFRQAIEISIEQGDTVADLGCGIGVLGLLCIEVGAGEVWGIDHSRAIHLARETIKKVGLEDRYHCLEGSTFRTELPERVDMIICDHVGYFGFDYGILALLKDARARFLKPGGTVMPRAMDLIVAAVSSDDCAEKAGAWRDAAIPDHYHWLDEYCRNSRHDHNFAQSELISSAAELGTVDFQTFEDDLTSFSATLKMTSAGRFDGIAGWFDCVLADDIRMTNSPLDSASIQRPQAFLPVERPFDVEIGEEVGVSIRFRSDGSMMAWTIAPPGGAARQKMSTWKGTILSPGDLSKEADEPVSLSQLGRARAEVLSLADGTRTATQIAAIVLAEHPALFPSEAGIRDFVREVIGQDCTT